MRTISIALLLVLIAAAAMSAPSLDNRRIHLEAGPIKSLTVPIALPCDLREVEGIVKVVETTTGKPAPATLRNGELVFVCEGAMPNTTHDYVVKVEKKFEGYVPRVVISKRENEDILDVVINDVPFTSYYYSNDWKKPFLWPVNSEGGVTVTRGYPMEPEGTPKVAQDHPHHKSLWSAYGDVNGADCWAEGENSGFQHSGEVTFGSGDAYGWIHAKNSWEDKDHKHILTEEREYRFYDTPEKSRLLDVAVTFTADNGDVTFKDTKEGGIVSVRMRPELSYANGVITNALGDQGEENLWGKPAAWGDYSGNMEGIGWRGLTVFDHPKNLRHPTSWHVRKYGLMGANCFGYSHFKEKEYNKGLLPAENGDYVIKAGSSLAFQYRVYVHTGDVKKAAVADRYVDYATPPKAAWAD